MGFRHEWKHTITPADLRALRARLGAVLPTDPHAADGRYFIRSLYFDNMRDKALKEKLDGVDRREKFRLRYYNGDASWVLLEKKTKKGGLCLKEQERASPEEIAAALRGDGPRLCQSEKALMRELGRKFIAEGLRAKTLIDYTREPFVYGPGGVRVTLDYGLRTALSPTGFLDPGAPTLPVPGEPVILEVKWDEYLPALIRDLVQTPGTRSGAFSKYAACRVFG